MKKLICAFFLLCGLSSVYGEIVQVTVSWTPGFCNPNCVRLLKENFMKVEGVKELRMNVNSGRTDIKWEPNSSFSYQKIARVMQRVGVGISNISLTVKGKIKESGKNAVLVSHGDNTNFILVSPLRGDPKKYTAAPNPFFRSLTPQLKADFLAEARKNKTFLIDGTLYQPAKSPLLQLIVRKFRIEKDDQ